MARKTQVVLMDDVDGTDATGTVGFALDGVNYEIDLNDEHTEQLRTDFSSWISNARRTGGRARRGTANTPGSDTKLIREWARTNGHEVSDRGRISAEVREAYAAANATS